MNASGVGKNLGDSRNRVTRVNRMVPMTRDEGRPTTGVSFDGTTLG
jgi:hypothetical protein